MKIKFLFFLIIIIFLGLYVNYSDGLKSVSDSLEEVVFEVEKGEAFSSASKKLEEEGLIKSSFVFDLYIKFNDIGELKAGFFKLTYNMDVPTIVENITSISTFNPNNIDITFREGITIPDVALLIEENTNNNYQEVLDTLKEEEYLNTLINDYWFLTNDIKKEGIYYSLEGYLFPDTYRFEDKDVEIKIILKKMLDEMNGVLEPYKSQIEGSSYSIHELITLASIVEIEAGNSTDRAGAAKVFYNRLDSFWSLGSDVTTYYGLQRKLSESDLTISELAECNDYNTRATCMAGKLPIGPISLPSSSSLLGVLNPSDHEYFYFVADINGKTYYNYTNGEHLNTISYLKENGLWFEYED